MSLLYYTSALLALLAWPVLAQPGDLIPKPCDLPGTDLPWADSAGVACYTLEVPENRADPASRTLRLAVAVATATGPDPAEPILYLHGGPGIATLDNVPRYLGSPAWQRLRERHALVFMDYRGTGQSEPAWCPELEESVRAIDRENPPDSVRIGQMAAAFRACRAAMEAEGLDLAGYSSAALAADAEALRQALGLPPWNVYGVSFGTHVALNLVRDHPEGVRALILDSVFPPNAPYLDWLRPFAEGLDVVASACAADPACAGRVPDVGAAFRAAVARLDAEQLDVPVDSTGRTDRVDGTDFAWSVWTALLNPRHIPLVPLAVEAGAARDSVALAMWARRFINPDAFGSNASAQFFAVWCFEGRPRTPEQSEEAALAAHPELAGFLVPGMEAAVCEAWQPYRAPTSAAEAVESSVATLVLSGAFDPVTRPADGHLAAATLPNAQVLDVPAASHAALHADACMRDLAAAFLAAPMVPLDAACIEERPPLRFVTEGTLAEALASPLAIVSVTIIDVETGARLPDHTIVVEGERIMAVGPATEVVIPNGATVVDGAGRFLLPGFADMHVHLYTEGDLSTYVARGVTTVRNMAGDSTHLAMRSRVERGEVVGPRIVTAGPPFEDPPSWHDHIPLADPAAARAEIKRQRAAGYDFIKVYNRLLPAVYDSVLAVAAEIGMPVAGHVPLEVGLDGALRARQGSIEHFRGYVGALDSAAVPLPLDASFRDRSVAWLRADTTRIAGLTARTVAAGVWNVPTFTFTVHELSPDTAHAALLARPELRYLSLTGLPKDRTASYLAGFSDADFAATLRGLEPQFTLLRALDRAGAGLLVGTDSWLAGYAYADELALLTRAGLSPARVLRMATLDAARFLGEEETRGTVAPGKLADLVLLDADPLAYIRHTARIHAVVLGGRLLNRADLDRLLDEAEATSSKSRSTR